MNIKQAQPFYLMGAVFGFLGVALGAFGAHILKESLEADLLIIFETGVRYQMYHIVPLFLVAWLTEQDNTTRFRLSGWFFIAGILIFSGSLYVLSLTGVRWLGAITPFGGVSLLTGWLLLGLGVAKRKQEAKV